jgi:hypothetical protein
MIGTNTRGEGYVKKEARNNISAEIISNIDECLEVTIFRTQINPDIKKKSDARDSADARESPICHGFIARRKAAKSEDD